jgi:hypothetical protein
LGGIHFDLEFMPRIEPATGEVVPNYTMLTQNCDSHPLLSLMHRPDPKLPADAQDKRSVVPIAPEHWDQWLHCTKDQDLALIQLPDVGCISHAATDPAVKVPLPVCPCAVTAQPKIRPSQVVR